MLNKFVLTKDLVYMLTISVPFDESFEASVVMILSKVIPLDNDRTTQYSTKTKNTL